MKHKVFLFAVLVATLAIPQSVRAYDFSYTYQGQTLYYYIDDEGAAVVTYRDLSENYGNLSGNVVIPNSVTYNNTTYVVTSIGRSAFIGCSGMTSVTIPNSVTSIGDAAFEQCIGMTSVSIGNSVTSIGEQAFVSCTGLTSVAIPNSVTSIGEIAFAFCSSLTSVTIGNSVTTIGDGAFAVCSSLSSVTIGNSVTTIGDGAFERCSSLTSVSFGNSVTYIGHGAFERCSSLTSVTIPNSVTSINGAFSSCSGLTSIVVENGNNKYDSRDNSNAIIETATNTLIEGCQNTVIPSSVTSIGAGAFYGCSSLTSITIPNSVDSIGRLSFYYCSGLTEITFKRQQPPVFGEGVFSEVPTSCTVYVPCGSLSLYMTCLPDFSSFVEDCGAINDIEESGISVWCNDGRIVVDGAESVMVQIYDMTGRMTQAIRQSNNHPNASGWYLFGEGRRLSHTKSGGDSIEKKMTKKSKNLNYLLDKWTE